MRSAPKMRGEFTVPLMTKGRLGNMANVPILACIGYNGMGKSALAAALAMQHASAGRPVLSTARLLDWQNPRPCADVLCEWPSHGEPGHMQAHPMWRPLTDYRQLFTWKDGHVWADEATGLADARNHQSMPGELADFLPRMRAKQVTFHWTTIHWSFADNRLRRVTWAAAWAFGTLPHYVGDEIWGRNRLFFYRMFDARNLPDDHDPAKVDARTGAKAHKSLVRGFVWGPRWDAFRAYDTLDAVSSLGGTDESGMCMVCGGSRGKKKCAGHGPNGEDLPAPVRGRRKRSDVDDHEHATLTSDDDSLSVNRPPASGSDDDRADDVSARLEVRGPHDGPPGVGRAQPRGRVRATDRAGVPRVRRGAAGPVRDDAPQPLPALRGHVPGPGGPSGGLGADGGPDGPVRDADGPRGPGAQPS